MTLAVVRSVDSDRSVSAGADLEVFEQELIDQYALAGVGAGFTDHHVAVSRRAVFEFVRFLGRPLWTAGPQDADRFLSGLRRSGLAASTVQSKAWALARFYEFVIARYQGDVHAVTGHVLVQPIDEYNRPSRVEYGAGRVPPSGAEVEFLFDSWRADLPGARKYLPAVRDYVAASVWRRVGLRIRETVMLDVRDWRPDLGEHGKLHVRFGKGSHGRGPKTRLVPAINSADVLVAWWLAEVRPQFGDDYADPDAPMFPSERLDPQFRRGLRIGDDALRSGLAAAVTRWLPAWQHRLTPHGLRHYCASSLYAQGLDLKAIQELLGHDWLSTTTRYIHVHDQHIERAWAVANTRTTTRLQPTEKW